MKVLIVAAGKKPSDKLIEKYAKIADYIIAADGGAEILLENDIEPDLFAGDCDSVSKEFLRRLDDMEKVILPVRKDKTDLEEALDCAIRRGASNIFILGALGKTIKIVDQRDADHVHAARASQP